MLGNVVARSVFAYLQSAAMGGYGVAAVNGVVQACAVISGGVVSVYSVFTGREQRGVDEEITDGLSSLRGALSDDIQAF